MKIFLVFSALLALAAAKYFTTGNDHLDVDEVMRHPDRIRKFVECFVDRAPCDALAESYKVIMPEAISTACRRCNDPQKHMWQRFLWGLRVHYPHYYEAYRQKYDPKNIYMDDMERAVADF
ncbi:unnamed protein product [Leptosia nina]|uniref:Uncharacterized protein n=1 Tax=Leptosia nina TaxID=320188 RepID=A0AAV1JSM7_9NEOP